MSIIKFLYINYCPGWSSYTNFIILSFSKTKMRKYETDNTFPLERYFKTYKFLDLQ